jgi:hypothetical protein
MSFSRSAFVTTRSGTWNPVPVMRDRWGGPDMRGLSVPVVIGSGATAGS